MAIQTAIALGVPVIDDLVIDTLATHQAASYPYQGQIMTGPGVGYPSAGPSTGLGYPGAGVYGYGSLPYTYPQPLFGKLDDPFFGFEPPAIGYPPWWGALTARRLGPQTIQTAQQGNLGTPLHVPDAHSIERASGRQQMASRAEFQACVELASTGCS